MSARRKSAVGLGAANNVKIKPTSMNFNIKNEALRGETKGTKPATNPSSIKEVLTMMILHICKKTIFFDIRLKVGLYIMCLFIISLIGGKHFHFFSLNLPQKISITSLCIFLNNIFHNHRAYIGKYRNSQAVIILALRFSN